MSASLSSRDHEHIWHPFTPQVGSAPEIPIVRGEGALLFDEAGNSWIDAISSWWVNLHGHCNPFIAQRVKEQLDQLEHVLFSGYTHAPAIELAEQLKVLLPYMDKVFYSDDGSTSVEVALKMAFQYWYNKGTARTKVIAFENAYHGDTFGSMSVGERNVFSNAFTPFLFDVVRIPVPVAGREQESLEALKRNLNVDTAAFIFEPLVLGAAGMIMYDAAVLDAMIGLCNDCGVVTIADEVMTGFGRTGTMFATDQCANRPAIICLSKGLTGGFMPLGATLCSAEIYSVYQTSDRRKTFFHGHSYTANPLACAAAIASLEYFRLHNVLPAIEKLEEQFLAAAMRYQQHPAVANARRKGGILAIELKTDEQTGYLNAVGENVASFFHERGVILRPLGNVIYVIPPYCITDAQLAKVLSVIDEFLEWTSRT